jgi:glycine cleavage system H protein
MDPTKLRYAETHEWVALDGDVATVGITKYAVEQLTDLVYVELPSVGRKIQIREAFGAVESVKSVNDLFAPVAGEVIATNDAVKEEVTTISSDPYGAGWLMKVRVAAGTTLDHLMTLAQYEQQIAEEQH